jgi:hypothetical protein
MRRKSLLTFIFGLLMLAGIGVSQAQTLTLMPWNNQWRYLITNALPTGFSASNYPAQAGWPVGPGPLSYDGTTHEVMPGGVPASMTLLATNFNNMFVTSFYFRTTFTLTTNPNNLIVTGTAVADDGAVIYVNGREVQRLGMNTGTVTHNTFANRGGEVRDAGRVESFSIASSNFVQGVNVIAASVHQQNGTSSDVVWGMTITAQVVLPVVITTQPEDQTAELGQRATFSVGVTGSNPTYRWYSNNVPILPLAGATNSSYQTPVATAGMNGAIYHVVVSNVLGAVRSSNAVLTVVQDTTGPLITLVSQWPGESNSLRVDFNEAVTQVTAENESNYVVHLLGSTATLSVTQSSWGGNYVRLRTGSVIDPDSNYVVCIYGLADNRNNRTFGDCAGATFQVSTNIFPMASCGWDYAPTVVDNHLDMTNWTATNFVYDPGDWGLNGCGLFYFDRVSLSFGCSFDNGYEIANLVGTQYFRKRFAVPPGLGTNVSAVITNMVDDGAVYYINGREIFRQNVPPTTPITYATTASSSVNATCQSFAVQVGHLLNPGTNNVLAVELHQFGDEQLNNDNIFDASLTLRYPRTPIVPNLNIARAGSQLTITWQGTGFALETATNVFGPTWQRLTTSNNRYQTTLPAGRAYRVYRLVNP